MLLSCSLKNTCVSFWVIRLCFHAVLIAYCTAHSILPLQHLQIASTLQESGSWSSNKKSRKLPVEMVCICWVWVGTDGSAEVREKLGSLKGCLILESIVKTLRCLCLNNALTLLLHLLCCRFVNLSEPEHCCSLRWGRRWASPVCGTVAGIVCSVKEPGAGTLGGKTVEQNTDFSFCWSVKLEYQFHYILKKKNPKPTKLCL